MKYAADIERDLGNRQRSIDDIMVISSSIPAILIWRENSNDQVVMFCRFENESMPSSWLMCVISPSREDTARRTLVRISVTTPGHLLELSQSATDVLGLPSLSELCKGKHQPEEPE